MTARPLPYLNNMFSEKVLEITSKIPKRRVTTYKIIARCLGAKAYRAVGNILNKSYRGKPTVPCHRVVRSNGEVGGYAKGTKEKIRLLREEGIKIKDNKITDLKKYLW